MKTRVIILAVIILGTVGSCRDSNKSKIKDNYVMQATQEQKEDILRAIDLYVEAGRSGDSKTAKDLYVEAGRSGDSKTAKEAFARTATMSWTENGTLKSVPIQTLYDYFDNSGPAKANYELTTLDVEGDAAIVRIESQFGDTQFADMFTLVKEGEKWKIISKIYHTKK